jgi:3'(2'), 5'-bisphosphate nucleotidase
LIIQNAIFSRFPGDPIIAEENLVDVNDRIRDLVEIHDPSIDFGLFSKALEENNGNLRKNPHPERFWVIDPIDGTKGFITENGNYAICGALVVNSQVQASVLVCPRLTIESSQSDAITRSSDESLSSKVTHATTEDDRDRPGVAFAAIRGNGAYQISIDGLHAVKLPVKQSDAATNRDIGLSTLIESFEASHSDRGFFNSFINTITGNHGHPPSKIIRMHSQCKYGMVARGDADIYLRKAAKPGYREFIWVSFSL